MGLMNLILTLRGREILAQRNQLSIQLAFRNAGRVHGVDWAMKDSEFCIHYLGFFILHSFSEVLGRGIVWSMF
jgi:hypothetical protein